MLCMAIQYGYVFLKKAGFTNVIKTLYGGIRLFESYRDKYGTELPLYFNCEIWNLLENFYKIDYPHFEIKELEYKKLQTQDEILNIRDAETWATSAGLTIPDYIHACKYSMLHFYKQYKIPPPVFFSKFKLHSTIQDIIREKRELLSSNYIGIHIRGGDYTFKYNGHEHFLQENSAFLEKVIKEHSSTPILLCTDDQTLSKKYVDDKNVFCFSLSKTLLDNNLVIPVETSLHTSLDLLAKFNISEYDLCLNTIVDFYLLAHSSQLYTNQHDYSTYAESVLQLNTFIITNNLTF